MGAGESAQTAPEVVEQENVQYHHQGIGENLAEKQECQNLIDCARENNIDVSKIIEWNEFINTHQCERFMSELDFNKNLDQSSICYVDEDLQGPLAQLINQLQTPEVIVPEEITAPPTQTAPEIQSPPVVETAPNVEQPPPVEPEIPSPTVVETDPEIPSPVVETAPVDPETPIVETAPADPETPIVETAPVKPETPVETAPEAPAAPAPEPTPEEEEEEEDPLTKCKNMVDRYPNESVDFFKLQPLFKGQGCMEYIPQLFPNTQTNEIVDEQEEVQQIQQGYDLLGKCAKIVADNPGEGKSFFEIQPLFKGMGCNDESIMTQLFPEEIQKDQSEEKIEVEDIQAVVEDGTPPEEFAQKLEACRSIVNNQRYVGKGKAFFLDQIIFKGEECETYADGKIMEILFPAK